MGGQDQRRPAGQDAQLDARGTPCRGRPAAPRRPRPRRSILAANDGPGLLLGAEHHRRVQQRAVEAAQVDHGVALAGEAVVRASMTTEPTGRGRSAQRRRAAASTASTERRSSAPSSTRHPGQPGDPPRPGLEPRPARRPAARTGQAQALGQLLLAGGDVERLHERPAGALAQLPDPVQQLRPVQQLGRERPGGRVAGGQHVQPRPRPRRVGQEARGSSRPPPPRPASRSGRRP